MKVGVGCNKMGVVNHCPYIDSGKVGTYGDVYLLSVTHPHVLVDDVLFIAIASSSLKGHTPYVQLIIILAIPKGLARANRAFYFAEHTYVAQ